VRARGFGARGFGARRIGFLAAVAVALLVALVPLLWMLSTSLKTNREITQDGTLIPHSFTFDNYANLFRGRSFGSYLTNSVVVTSASVAVALLLGTHAAYALARFRRSSPSRPCTC
jgi:multiple sugar transport system permease protein